MFESGSRFSPGLLGQPLRLFAACAALATVLAAQQPYVVATIPTASPARHSVGASLAPAADVDLDGSQDLLVGFPYNDNEAGEATSDQIAFPNYAGSSGFHVWSPLTGAFIRTITEPGNATRGFALVNLGDINGDGKPDAAVSNPSFSQAGGNWVGRVDAYSGADGSVLWSFVSTSAGGQAGVSLSRIADVDFDGKPDVLVGASGTTGIAGRVFVISAQTGALLRTHVGATGDMLGFATSDAGDVDGDGTSDYAAGAPQAGVTGATQPAGYVRIWSGATGAVIRTVNGVTNFDRFGRALAPAGDLNGDGVSDLYVGAPSRFALTVPGRVYAISGANGSFLLNATRNVPGDRFGWSLAAVGDRNGDGKIDVAAGTAAGVVEVRSGAFGGVLFVQNGLPGQAVMQGLIMKPFAVGDLDGDSLIDVAIGSINSAENGLLTVFTSSGPQRTLAGDDSHGAVSSIAALGDLDGDGIRDLAISNSQANTPSANDAGQVVIRSSTGAILGTLSGTLPFEYFGWSVSTLDDVNNDGVEDFLVASNPTTAGKVTCYSGATGAALYSVVGTTPGGFFGYAIARLSDLNGDGIREFAAGAPYSNIAGLATTGQVHVCSGANGAILITVNGLAGGEFFGTPIAEIGDINGDNVADLIVGAGYASPGGVGQAGVARILSGSTGQILRTHSGTLQGIALGRALCGAGDVDLDGVPDYAIGSPANVASGGPAGPVLVHSGATGLVIRTIAPSPVPPGFSVNDFFGVGLSNGGDLDGDGFADLVLGVAPWLGFPPVQAREIHAYSGLNGALISKQVASPAFTPSAPSPAATGFDLTGDGAPDWAAFGYSGTITPAPIAIVSRAGVPAGSSSTGAGCNLAALLPPVLQTGGGALVAAAGAPQFELLVSRAAPNQAGAFVVGASNTSWNGTPLPLNLAGFGLPGCLLHNSVDTLFPFVTTQAGLAGSPVPLPANPALAGATAHVQAFLVGGGGTISSSTNGLTLVVQ